SALLAIDQNRTSVVDRIVAQWGESLAQSSAALSREQLRNMLMSVRADHLLAASLAGNLEGLRNALSVAVTSTQGVHEGLLQAKALGDAGDDLTYTPVTPCRLVETRGTFAAVYQGDGTASHNAVPFASNEVRSYTLQG